jgi:hypothetical protein
MPGIDGDAIREIRDHARVEDIAAEYTTQRPGPEGSMPAARRALSVVRCQPGQRGCGTASAVTPPAT